MEESTKQLIDLMSKHVNMSNVASYWEMEDVLGKYIQADRELRKRQIQNSEANCWANEDNYKDFIPEDQWTSIERAIQLLTEEQANSNLVIAINEDDNRHRILNYKEAIIYLNEGEDALWSLPAFKVKKTIKHPK